jgi:hypothetical protein
MKNIAKLIVISVFGLGALFMLLGSAGLTKGGSAVLAYATPTPPANAVNTVANAVNVPANANANAAANTNANVAANTNANAATPATPAAGDKTMTKSFMLAKDSLDAVHGAAAFDHETHAFGKYSPDGTATIGCVECHHTDQPKSALKAPLVTSEREVALTFDSWKASAQKVNECRVCHFQSGDVPDGKEMPVARGKEYDNQLAYHTNCNDCHDAAVKERGALKGKKGFATSKDCLTCHLKNN